MRSLLLFVLASYAVRCDDTSYYVVQMPEENPPPRYYRKPFKVYWNVPTMQCRSKKIPFENLYEKFGIIQNKNDSFRGEEITILYDPGLFPALLKNETKGKFKFRNGGVPQQGDLDKHISAFKTTLDESIPNPGFSGIGIIDFESWRPVFRQNFGVLVPYKDVSYEIEKKLHWWWPKQWLQSEAKQRFEEAARKFMQTTLSVAKQLRPNALWGYYGFPYCFNMASNNKHENCADRVPQENDGIYWLWSESTAIYPSVYSSRDLTSSQLAALIRGRVKEATRVKRRGSPILPYFWFRYRDGEYLSKVDLTIALQTMYKSNASGFIVWGSSKDVNTVDKCKQLKNYIENVFGPAIAKYTNTESKLEDHILGDITVNDQNIDFHIPIPTVTINPMYGNGNKIISNDTKTSTPDPEFHWEPPENYTEDIAQYVKDELNKNPKYNDSLIENTSTINPYNNIYTNWMVDPVFDDAESIENITEIASIINTNQNDEKDINKGSTTEQYLTSITDYTTSEGTTEYDLNTTSVMDLSTNLSMKLSKNSKKGTPISQAIFPIDSLNQETTTEYFYTESTTTPLLSDYEENIYESYLNDTLLYNEENSTITLNSNTTESTLVKINEHVSKNDKKGYAKQTSLAPSETVASSTESYEDETSTNDDLNDITHDFSGKNRKKGVPTTWLNDTDTNDRRSGVQVETSTHLNDIIHGFNGKNRKKGVPTTWLNETDTNDTRSGVQIETSTHLNDMIHGFNGKNRKKGLPTTWLNDTDTNDTRPGVHTIFVQQVVV